MTTTAVPPAEWEAAGSRAEAKAVHELTGKDVYLEHWYTPKSETEPKLVRSGRYHVKRVRLAKIDGTPYLVFDTTDDEQVSLLEYEPGGRPEFAFVDGPIGERALHFRVSCAGTMTTRVVIVG